MVSLVGWELKKAVPGRLICTGDFKSKLGSGGENKKQSLGS